VGKAIEAVFVFERLAGNLHTAGSTSSTTPLTQESCNAPYNPNQRFFSAPRKRAQLRISCMGSSFEYGHGLYFRYTVRAVTYWRLGS
jgi:hypothetical protein